MRAALALGLLLTMPLGARAELLDDGFADAEAAAKAFAQAPRPVPPRRGVMGLGRNKEVAPSDAASKPDPTPYAVRGLDVSHYEEDIDWKQVGADGLSFVYIKATEGADFVDDHFAANWPGATSAGLAKGAYHFYNFCRDGASQAANFIGHVPAEAGALPPTIDLEESDDCASLPGKAAFRADFAVFVTRLESAYGQTPVLYVDYSIYKKYFAGEGDPYPVWIADVSHPAPSLPDGKAWRFWQYEWHGHVAGIAGEVDLDAFAGDLSDLDALRKPAPALAALP